ncbi:transposase, MuDR, MULE transposase domain protein [Tanacetum coccineum]
MNESIYKNEPHFTKSESSFVFGTNDENEDEQNDCNDGVDENPQPIYNKWNKFMSFKPDIPETPLYKSKPMISKHYNKEIEVEVGNIFDNKETLDLAIRLKALDDGYQFLTNKSAPESLERKNQGTVTRIKANEGLFEMLFIAIGASDGNNQIMPVGFGICKGETGPCWSWWMSVLKECIGDIPNLFFISDRHPAIALVVHN